MGKLTTAGTPGATGATGAAGLPGLDGEPGEDGLPGLPGPEGPAGAAGSAGAAGAAGATGAPGMGGEPGEDGDVGPPGVAGSAGASGAAGADGAQGLPGPPGMDGEPGEEGATGPPGIEGATGPSGVVGPPGMDGDDASNDAVWGPGVTRHSLLLGLDADDHTQYARLAGRSGGQILKGGTGVGEDLSFWTNATGTVGTFYFTDLVDNGFVKTSGGTGALSVDTTLYQKESGLLASRVMGLTGANNAGTPNTQYDFAADAVVLANSTGEHYTKLNTGTITNNVSTAGPAANGRDQAGAFGASSWVHFYFIYNPTTTTLATISSATAPPTGPTLPAGYTHWAYATAIRFKSSSYLAATYIRGASVFYQCAGDVWALAGGAATVETAVDIAALIPPNAFSYMLSGNIKVTKASTGRGAVNLRVKTAVDYLYLIVAVPVANFNTEASGLALLPNVGQNFYYLWEAAYTSMEAYLALSQYLVPNGDS